MNGPEHYAEAERLLRLAESTDWTTEIAPYRDQAIAAAQAHATLALAAATAYPAVIAYTGDERNDECRGWASATAPQRVSA